MQASFDRSERLAAHVDEELVALFFAHCPQPVVDRRAVALTKLSANIQAEAGASAPCGKERFEQVLMQKQLFRIWKWWMICLGRQKNY